MPRGPGVGVAMLSTDSLMPALIRTLPLLSAYGATGGPPHLLNTLSGLATFDRFAAALDAGSVCPLPQLLAHCPSAA